MSDKYEVEESAEIKEIIECVGKPNGYTIEEAVNHIQAIRISAFHDKCKVIETQIQDKRKLEEKIVWLRKILEKAYRLIPRSTEHPWMKEIKEERYNALMH